MKMKFNTLFTIIMALNPNNYSSAQCAETANIYSFNYNGKTYEIIRENQPWLDAVACAVERGGYLVEINSEVEQNKIFTKVKFDADINPDNTTAFECGTCAYVWIGGHDLFTEGNWIWDGNYDGIGDQFWMGDESGSPVGGLYSNWGQEPDNFSNQDAAGLAIVDWILGNQGQWNDVRINNSLYYVIEYDMILGLEENEINKELAIYPNPVRNEITIINQSTFDINRIEVFSLLGQKVSSFDISSRFSLKNISLVDLKTGIYFLNIHFENGEILVNKIVKQ